MTKRCELCSQLARMYCQSDNASLCYDCDQNVHSANFLVTKHSRTLLCHRCQSPTPWTASGLNLGRAASVCVNCLDEESSQRPALPGSGTNHRGNDIVEENREDTETDDDNTESSDENESEDEDEDEDAENQVVPWSVVASPPVTASSSSEEYSSSRFSSDGFRSAIKRGPLDAYIDSEDDTVCSSERSIRPLKVIRSERNGGQREA